jgi:hypothetical protein
MEAVVETLDVVVEILDVVVKTLDVVVGAALELEVVELVGGGAPT